VSTSTIGGDETTQQAVAPASPAAPTAAEIEHQARVDEADRARRAFLELSTTVLEAANKAARTGLRFALFPVVLMSVVGSAMIAVAMFETVTADPRPVLEQGTSIVMTGTALSTAGFVAAMVVGATLLLAAPVVLHFAGDLARSSVTHGAQPDLDRAAEAAKSASDALAGAFSGYDGANAGRNDGR